MTERRQYSKAFLEAKENEYKSWVDNDVFELVDLRKVKCQNFVKGRWVLTIKRDKDGKFVKCKARWVLQGFLDKQKDEQQKDSPTSSRPGFRLACQYAANKLLDLYHIDLKTAFLQGEAYDELRNVRTMQGDVTRITFRNNGETTTIQLQRPTHTRATNTTSTTHH